MPYYSRFTLPDPVRDHLSAVGQTIYMHAYNNAWHQISHTETPYLEEHAHDAAWAVIKKLYRRNSEGDWVPKN